MKEISTEKLRHFIDAAPLTDSGQMFYADMFASGCIFHLQGHKEAGLKLCSQVLSMLGYTDATRAYFQSLLQNLEGNEASYVRDIWAHNEINAVMDSLNRP